MIVLFQLTNDFIALFKWIFTVLLGPINANVPPRILSLIWLAYGQSNYSPLSFPVESALITILCKTCSMLNAKTISLYFWNEEFETRMHSSRMRTAQSLPYKGEVVSVQGGSLFERSLSGGSLSRGSLSRGVSVQGGCLSLSREVYCQGVSVRETPPEGTWDQRQRPPGRNMGPGSHTGSVIIHRLPPCEQNETHLWKHYLAPNFVKLSKRQVKERKQKQRTTTIER